MSGASETWGGTRLQGGRVLLPALVLLAAALHQHWAAVVALGGVGRQREDGRLLGEVDLALITQLLEVERVV